MTDVPGPRSSPSREGEGAGDVVLSDPDVRAGLRLLLALGGAVVLALVLGPVAVLVHDRWDPLIDLDERTTAAAERAVSASPLLLDAARLLTHLGDPAVVTVGTVVAGVLLLRAGRRRAALFVLVARVGSLLLSTVTKDVVGRARPVFEVPVAHAGGASFPSGHALGGSVFWLTTALVVVPYAAPRLRRLLVPGAVLVAVVIAMTRVLLGVHFLSDVVAGLLVGSGWTAVCAAVFALWRSEEGRPAPVLEQGVDAP